ncbi:NAD-dependent epimerase/dehydratase family protein [Polynucleobacter paneuropaeus]|nr:NAD-dependent epimerase/dehydratase family protein [Polynucleobacter paneuropaeus]
MKIMVTGATGFVGRHLVKKLLQNRHQVIAVARNIKRAKEFEWFNGVDFIQADLHLNYGPVIEGLHGVDALIHLAWPGLPNYQGNFHIFQNLKSDLVFLKASIESGLSHLVVAGTCLEYGLQSGAISEDMDTHPITPYGFAKDSLRKSLQFYQKEYGFTLQWMRLFYMYGEGQSPKSLLSQLDKAIDEKRQSFDMSIGTQLRDYLPIEAIAERICTAVENSTINGVINCSSGSPISVLELVRRRCQERGSDIHLNLGYFSLPEYEPLEFWGIPAKLNSLSI